MNPNISGVVERAKRLSIRVKAVYPLPHAQGKVPRKETDTAIH
jgi:hypothetical protein